MPPPPSSTLPKPPLQTAIHPLLNALSTPTPLPTLLSTFTTNPTPTALEHGLKTLAPFLGRPFTGQEGLKTYFEILGECLVIEKMVFEDEGRWVVDAEKGVVCLRGEGVFVWKDGEEGEGDTDGRRWEEVFIYRLEVAEDEDGEVRVSRYEVWADTGAAYLARVGGLEGLKE